MRYQTKLLITAGLLLALSLSAAALAYWGVSQSHSYLSRSRIAHQELERQLQLSRHSQQLFKSWTDTLLTGISDRPLGAAYLHKVIESDIAELERLTQEELAMIPARERRIESAEVERLNAIKKEFQHALDQLDHLVRDALVGAAHQVGGAVGKMLDLRERDLLGVRHRGDEIADLGRVADDLAAERFSK